MSTSQSPQSLTVGFVKIQILDCLLNVKVKQSYIILTLGDQQHQSFLEDCKKGKVFQFNVTFHAQLFGTIQIDLFDSSGLFYSTDKHLGRTEMRLGLLKYMPPSFTSYYEIWDKTLSSGASSSVGRERTRVNNIGAFHLQIEHQFIQPSTDDTVLTMNTVPITVTNLIKEELSVAETKRHLRFSRERKEKQRRQVKNEDLKERVLDQYSESEEEDIMQPLAFKKSEIAETDEEDEEFGEMVSAPSNNEMNDDNEYIDDSIEKSESKGKDQVIKMIGKLMAAFGQGFELTYMQVVSGLSVLEKYFDNLPRERSWNLVRDLSEIEMASRFWKFSVASYGWKGLNFIGKGNGILSDAIREHSDAKSIIEYLMIPKEDLLAYEFRSAEAFRPSYFIARDRFTNSIVLSIRGTMSLMDTLTDLVCEYEPWKGGFVHSGMKHSAVWFFQYVVPQLKAFMNEHEASCLIVVGHSLGAATAAILTDMLIDHLKEFQEKIEGFNLKCFGYAPACGLSLELAEKHKDVIQSFVFADDIASKMSYGSMMDVKELIIASVEAARNTVSATEILLGSKVQGESWQRIFERIGEVRKRLSNGKDNPKLYVAGQIYQFWADPMSNNKNRIVVEKTNAELVSNEIVVKKSILADHLPTNFDLAFYKAREAIMLGGFK
ncbi:hypothetical protein G6F57_004635 [Rhizopus arrhizus]|uniref:sn-1-specific diacylglycerol lipase n=1 Tax=Rhizopus oryzae TaxID=64495 RepID=A0A9P7BSS3_RHIOR|nr:hypothetical protein G6F23_002130 [Rhizopus arrhizus]KAG1427457.1 hypothetical protein G6F58_001032 [Rhizopus delemar]KAG0763554.1 hypothetical protein G6F24_005922 [Rhizopus arrhizus]KAG0793581.1 hypothetical protein G6F21_003506 [Rhizopus arrhizus]KAG0800874.1 hypothetical protein G6F22_001797 [Rhizopus arrhizus]